MQDYFVHPQGICETKEIGKNTKIWAFAHILPGAVIGKNCNICDFVFIENDVKIGDNVTIKCGVQLWDGIRLEDNVFIGPNVTFTNDIFPRSKQYPEKFLETRICPGASIGANATILPGITIGENAMVGAGSVVTKNVLPNTVVAGNPARVIRHHSSSKSNSVNITKLEVGGCELWSLPSFSDNRGDLLVAEYKNLPFKPKRSFFICKTPGGAVRGEHAHKQCHQFIIALSGSVKITLDDGIKTQEILLNKASLGINIPPKIWATVADFKDNAVVGVFASHEYEESDYIRIYDEFKQYVGLIKG